MEYERALQRAADPQRLMEGEDPGTTLDEDARHWADVYAELIAFNQELLMAMGTVVGDGEVTIEHTGNVGLLEAHLERLRYRLAFWQGRLTEGAGTSAG